MEFLNFPRDFVWLIPILPLLGAMINGLLGFFQVRLPKWAVSLVACSAMVFSFFMAVLVFFEVARIPEGVPKEFVNHLYHWIQVGSLTVDIAFLADPLSAVMILIVTGVGSLIHFYSIGYMHKDPGFQRYFAYLNLFVFFMLLLVLGENILLMFVGWEGVGLCSYLLIGFWFKDIEKATAVMKAFLVNRIGDFAFSIGFIWLYWALAVKGVHTLSFIEIREHAHLLQGMMTGLGVSVVAMVTFLFFFGATGKSAQIPLYVWLPDAMAGPTPVSALIHAATMVTAGVYMIGRTHFLYTMAPGTMMIVATVGVFTALFAGTIALTQNDIKKVLAYSTVSQLGYMFLGMGVGAFGAGILHLTTHAFFKGLMFLGAGSVIHAMHHEQDMRKMGGLKNKIPWTFWTFMAGYIAIIGFPFTSGFISKDEILWKAFDSGTYGKFLWVLGWMAAGITAFYMSRLMFMTFFGESRVDKHTAEHLHESPKIMVYPLAVLAVLSIVGGLVGWPEALGGHNRFSHWLSPVFNALGGGHGAAAAGVHPSGGHDALHLFLEYFLMFLSVSLAAVAVWFAWKFYAKPSSKPKEIAARHPQVYQTLFNKYYIDEFYQKIFVKRLFSFNNMLAWLDQHIVDGLVNFVGKTGEVLSKFQGLFDNYIIDGLVDFVGHFAAFLGEMLRKVQTGRIQNYVYFAILTVTIMITLRVLFL